MFTNLLAREQLRTIRRLWSKPLHPLATSKLLHPYGCNSLQNTDSSISAALLQETDVSLIKHLKGQRFCSNDNPDVKEIEKKTTLHETVGIADDGDALAPHFNLKELIYDDKRYKGYEDKDDAMEMLNQCNNSEELNHVLDKLSSKIRKEYLVQTIILLWLFYKEAVNRHLFDVELLGKTVNSLEAFVDSLNLNEMSACYLYLRRMGVDNSNPVVQNILMKSLEEIKTSEKIIDLPALSRLIVGVNTGNDFFIPMLCASFLRHLDYHVSRCSTEDDARFIAICIINLQPIIDDDLINRYKSSIRHLLEIKTLGESTPKTVIKILNMLNMGVWCSKHVSLIRDLLLSLQPVIKKIDAIELRNVCRIYNYHLEPACLHPILCEAAENLLSSNMSPESLACFVPFAQPHKRESLINCYKALVSSSNSWHRPNASTHLFSTLRGLKISDPKICDAYWDGVLGELNAVPDGEMNTNFLKHCHRYMNFNNNLGGTYRHKEIEKRLSQLCMRYIEHDIAGRLPKTFARLTSFVLAYGHTPFYWKKYPNILLSKIINMAEQFTPIDCSILSRGLEISLELRFRNRLPQLVGLQLSTIDSVLATCMERFFSNDKLSSTDLNILVRTLSNRKSLKNSVVYHNILQKFKDVQCEDLNSRTLKEMAYNLMATDYLVPEALEAMFKYLENNYDYVVGETVDKLLNCSYNLGYTPESCDALHCAGQVLIRDFNYMSGLSLVQSCLALCYYKTIPEELIDKVFCVKFIQRVEDEIQMCYSKATYPERVLNTVMQLNRSVCLDFPEANVPWFQQNFIEAQISKKSNVETPFRNEVKAVLTKLFKDDSYIRFNHTTPYGYHIDFVINFDQDRWPLNSPVETTMLDRITKVAILLLKLDSFCANDLNALRGPDSLKIKHLEMMGYKVLHINEHDWNSKYMNAPGAKTKYLKCLLQISS